MADESISALSSASAIKSADLIPIVTLDGATPVTKNISGSNLFLNQPFSVVFQADLATYPSVVSTQPVPRAPFSATVSAGGSVDTGVHSYAVTFTDASGSTTIGTSISATTTSSNKTVTLAGIPLGMPGTTTRKIYRTAAGAGILKYLATISDNTTTSYVDTTADASLGALVPNTNTTTSRPKLPTNAFLVGSQFASNTDLTLTVNTSQIMNGYWGTTVADANDGDWYYVDFPLASGTYSLKWLGILSASRGKTDVYLDGTKVVSGWDWYASSTTYNSLQTQTGITVSTSGMHRLEILVNGKNASSSDYGITISYIQIIA